MLLIVAVYDALRSFDRPCTRAELERAAGLGKDEVREGLRGLQRRGDLLICGSERQRATYRLRPSAGRPEDLRGKGAKGEGTRAKMSAARLQHRAARPAIVFLMDAAPGVHRAASTASHRSEPGALRTVRNGLSLGGGNHPIGPCSLARHWRRR